MSFSEWKNYKLGEDVVTKLGDGLHGTPKYDDNGKYYFINGSNFVDGKVVINSNTKKVTEEQFIKYKKDLSERTILLGINGTIGNIALYNNEMCILGKSAAYLNVNDDFDKQFIRYILANDHFQNYIKNNASGTTIKNVGLGLLREYEFLAPNKNTQTKIANILSSLDDKIELNRQTNQTLEVIAQTLFKEMCLPKSDDLPNGWSVSKLGELVEIKYGKDHKHLEDGNIPVYGSGGIMRYANKALYEKESILIPRKGTLSNLFYINKPFWSVDTMFYTKIKEETHVKFLFLLLKSLNLASMNVGSAVPSLTTEILNKLEVILPSEEVLKKFDVLVTPLFKTLELNIEENQTLINLRHSLLPKLMKGEIAI